MGRMPKIYQAGRIIMLISKNDLSEDTRIQTIHIEDACYDLHLYLNTYYICEHGTYNVLCSIMEEFYTKLFPGKN
jgi:hypothetical protein